MCCKIDVNSSKDAVHFLGKGEPTLLPKTCDNASKNTDTPALSLFDKWMAKIRHAH